MKKTILFFAIICFLFLSCNNNTNSVPSVNGQVYQNNANDDIFETSLRTDINLCASLTNRNGFLNGYIRRTGSSGIIGTWYKYYDKDSSAYRIEELTFNVDGTWTNITNRPVRNETNRSSGRYEVCERNGDFYIKIFYSTREYNLQYFVSNGYFCHEESGCPI